MEEIDIVTPKKKSLGTDHFIRNSIKHLNNYLSNLTCFNRPRANFLHI